MFPSFGRCPGPSLSRNHGARRRDKMSLLSNECCGWRLGLQAERCRPCPCARTSRPGDGPSRNQLEGHARSGQSSWQAKREEREGPFRSPLHTGAEGRSDRAPRGTRHTTAPDGHHPIDRRVPSLSDKSGLDPAGHLLGEMTETRAHRRRQEADAPASNCRRRSASVVVRRDADNSP